MKVALCLTLLAIAVIAVQALSEAEHLKLFDAWTNQHNKVYASEQEKRFRFNNFRDNLEHVIQHNADSANTYKLAMNKFGDLTEAEFSLRLGKRSRTAFEAASRAQNSTIVANVAAAPTEWDWRSKGVVTPIKDQGDCGSCWTFSSVGAIESAKAIAGGSLDVLSEQQLVDCSTQNYGCDGGLIDWAYDYIISAGGVELASCYPYTARDGTCKFKSSCVAAKISGYKALKSGDEAQMLTATYSVGPLSIGIYASSRNFMLYSSGVFSDSTCKSRPRDLDHAVIIVGYGVQSNQKYWLIKNSWGTSWGVKGYMYIARDAGNMCGVATEPFYPIM